MSSTLARYRAAVSQPKVRGPLFWSVVGRLPLFMMALALVLTVQQEHQSYVRAGLVVAAYTIGDAVGSLAIARRMDRVGQTTILLATGVAFPVALICLAIFGRTNFAVECVLAAAAGVCMPPIGTAARSLWKDLALGEQERSSLYFVEAILSDLLTIIGPLLVSGIAVLASPSTSLVVAGVLGGAGSIGVAATRASREWQGSVTPQGWLGPLRSGPLLIMLGNVLLCSIAIGIYNLVIPAFSAQHGHARAAGWMFAAWGIGSALGGLWYGGRTPKAPFHRQYIMLLVLFVVGLTLPVVAVNIWTFGIVLAVGGTVIAPIAALEYQAVQRFAPDGTVAAAFTWLVVASIAGSAIGAQLGGAVVNVSTAWGFAAAGVVSVVATGIAYLARSRIATQKVESG